MVLCAGEDRNMHRLDDWKVCFAGAVNPVGERIKHSRPLIVFLPFKVLLDEPIGKRLRIIGRSCGRSSQRDQQEKCNYAFDNIPSSSKQL